MPYNKPGRLILFEGGDGCGKTSQMGEIARWLPSITAQPVVTAQEPFVVDIRQAILDNNLSPLSELLLFMSDRAQHFATVIQPQLEAGVLVLCDRGFPSTYAYQGHGRKLSLRALEQLNEFATKGIRPDLVIWLDAPPEIGLMRSGRGDRLEQESIDFHKRVRHGYQDYLNVYGNTVRIDATQPLEVVNDRIKDSLKVAIHLWGKS